MREVDWDTAAERMYTEFSTPLEVLKPWRLWMHYKVASYAYYGHNVSIMSDERFDALCREMLRRYDPRWIHCGRETLEAGTGYAQSHGCGTRSIFNAMVRRGIV
jgi:hypothetical protein